MHFPFYIAKRYIRSRSKQNAVNIINYITFFVIVVGSAALFIVLSAFSGLKDFSLQFTNTFDPDLKTTPAIGKYISIAPEMEERLLKIEGIQSLSKEIEERAYLTFQDKSHLAYIKGIDVNYRRVTGIDSTLLYGNWGVNEFNGVVGSGIAYLLNLTINNYQDPMMVLTLKPGEGLVNKDAVKTVPIVVSGVFAIEEELDKKYLFAPLSTVQSFLEKDSTQISAINFKLDQPSEIESIKKDISTILGNQVITRDRQELNTTLYRMLNTENLATYLIFTLVLIIALFNVVGAIIMMILDNQNNLKTLYSLGSTIRELRSIYFLQGAIVTFLGGLIGIAIGLLVVGTQLMFSPIKITPSLAYPVALNTANILVVIMTIGLLGFISSKIASSRISSKLLNA